MVCKFPEKVSKKSGNCWIPKSESFNRKMWKFREEVRNGTEIPSEKFRKFGYSLQVCPLFGTFWTMQLDLSLEVFGNWKWNFSWNGKCFSYRTNSYPCPRGFSWFFFFSRSGEYKSRSGEFFFLAASRLMVIASRLSRSFLMWRKIM